MYKALICAAAAALTFSAPANAALLNFNLTGDYTASWTLDSNPTPDWEDGSSFVFVNLPGNFPGSDDNRVTIVFVASNSGGGLLIDVPISFYVTGPQLFSGTTARPTFHTGTFLLADFSDGPEDNTLVISEANAAIPEPATWAMMIAGFGLIGSALRRRREQAAHV